MLIPQKVFAHLLIAVLAFGSIGCPCPAQANSEAGSHAHHQSQKESPAATDHAVCQHAECVRISADSSAQDATLSCKGKFQFEKFQFDDTDAIESETIASLNRTRSVAWTGPPLPRSWLSRDTPVSRFDRLLD